MQTICRPQANVKAIAQAFGDVIALPLQKHTRFVRFQLELDGAVAPIVPSGVVNCFVERVDEMEKSGDGFTRQPVKHGTARAIARLVDAKEPPKAKRAGDDHRR